MENKELLQYLKDAIEQETDIVQQEELIRNFNREKEQKKPVLVLKERIEKPKATEHAVKRSFAFFLIISIFLLIIGVSVVSNNAEAKARAQRSYNSADGKVGRSYSSSYREYEQREALEDIREAESGVTTGIILICVGFGFAAVAGYINRKTDNANKAAQAEHTKELTVYQSAMDRINKENAARQSEYDKKIKEWRESANATSRTMSDALARTQSTLQRFYEVDYIYPKYRTLPALTSIYEYFMTGRCTELTGPHGAYNLYEDEVRKDTIINRLDTVIENLEQIRNNQYMLYQQVKSIKENTDIMVSELRQIKGYSIAIAELTALNAYYAQLTERNTRITMYYQL